MEILKKTFITLAIGLKWGPNNRVINCFVCLIASIFPVGALDLNNELMICGGQNITDIMFRECYIYRDKEWIATHNLNEPRSGAAMTRVPTRGLFVTGGEVCVSSQ